MPIGGTHSHEHMFRTSPATFKPCVQLQTCFYTRYFILLSVWTVWKTEEKKQRSYKWTSMFKHYTVIFSL